MNAFDALEFYFFSFDPTLALNLSIVFGRVSQRIELYQG
jgi:hypothetical protein